MYLINRREAATIEGMRAAYDRLEALGWSDIRDFKPVMKAFGPAPFLGIEVGSFRIIECL